MKDLVPSSASFSDYQGCLKVHDTEIGGGQDAAHAAPRVVVGAGLQDVLLTPALAGCLVVLAEAGVAEEKQVEAGAGARGRGVRRMRRRRCPFESAQSPTAISPGERPGGGTSDIRPVSPIASRRLRWTAEIRQGVVAPISPRSSWRRKSGAHPRSASVKMMNLIVSTWCANSNAGRTVVPPAVRARPLRPGVGALRRIKSERSRAACSTYLEASGSVSLGTGPVASRDEAAPM